MASTETPQDGQQREAPPGASPADTAAQNGRPPAYDTSHAGYAGISSGVLDSIHDLRAARDFAEMIVDTVREGLLVLDPDLHVLAANESFYERFEVPPDAAVGRLVYELGNGGWDIPRLRELLEDILPHEKAFNDFEVDHAFKGLGRRQMLLNARRLDHHEMILLAIEDVTERRAGRAGEAAADRPRPPRRPPAGPLRRPDGRRRQRRRALSGILAGALDLTRTLSHELSPPLLQGEDVEDLLRWLAEVAREQFGLDVRVEVGAGVPVPDAALRVLLYQVVRELLFNVAKHAGVRRARLVAERTDSHIRVVAEDEGAGFGPAALGEAGAVGLGLPSARGRLELVGGRLEVASEPGEGTRVTMEVPLRPE